MTTDVSAIAGHLAAPRGRVYDSIIDTVGGTPLVRLSRLCAAEGVAGEILAKLEFFNPLASVKDRIGVAMIEALEADGTLAPGGTVIEPTSGNTGIGLAFVCAVKGYRLILTMPDSMSVERRKMMGFLGAELELAPAAEGIKGAMAKADCAPMGLDDMDILGPARPDAETVTEDALAGYLQAARDIFADAGNRHTECPATDPLAGHAETLRWFPLPEDIEPRASAG